MLSHKSIFFDTRYRMVKSIEEMMFIFFYANEFKHDAYTKISNRSLSVKIQAFFKTTFNVDSSFMMYKIEGQFKCDSTKSAFNIKSVFGVLNLTAHKTAIRKSAMGEIQTRTMNSMQSSQHSFIIMNLVKIQRLEFLKLGNRGLLSCEG